MAMALIFIVANIILDSEDKGDEGRPYRVEAERIARKIENGESYDLKDYKYIENVEVLTVDREMPVNAESSSRDHIVREINGGLYRFDYFYNPGSGFAKSLFNKCFFIIVLFVIALLVFIYIKIIRPFELLADYPAELAKGNLTVPLKEDRGKYFGSFLWGLDLLRERIEDQRTAQLALQQQNKTMVLSLSHDIKTPLGVIELYAKALEKGLYKDERKKIEVAKGINSKCEDIRRYVDDIVKTSSEDFLNLEVVNGEFYLSELMENISDFYTDKLELLKTGFKIDGFSDCMLSGDLERGVEVIQNIMENAIKYGDGKEITITFSTEEDCRLINIANSGCTLTENELPHIFDSFWRGSNTGINSGSGLGLYICRTLMRKMNGDIFARIIDGNMVVSVVFLIS